MINPLFALIFAEMLVIVLFTFKTPFRKFLILGLDRAKRGRGPVVVKSVAGTLFVVMMTCVYGVAEIHKRWLDDGEISVTDQILYSTHLLEASLLGYALFLGLMIDRLHHYMRELRLRRKTMEAAKKQNQAFENGKNVGADEIKMLVEQTANLRARLTHLESELEGKKKEASTAEANTIALKKQSEGFLLEYDRLLEENQNLRSQLQSLDRSLSRSDSKKVM